MKYASLAIFAAVASIGAADSAKAERISLNVSGLVSTHIHHTAAERKFYENLGKQTGLDLVINFNPLDVIGVKMDDTLRLAGDGTFDIVQATLGSVARDDPFIEGPDLIGVSPSLADLRKAVDAFREAFGKRTEERLNVKTLAIWPYGPQLIFCKDQITGLSDLRGKRVRSYTRTMSALLEHVGATPVSMPFAEVYPSLQRGVVECAITSITSSNSGSWPEITTHVLTLGLSHGLNANFMNLDSWKSLSPKAQKALSEAFRAHEQEMWDLTAVMYEDGMRCSTGQEPCKHYKPFKMNAVAGDEKDRALLAEATSKVVLGVWANACRPTGECVKTWNATVGKVRGFEMKAGK